jgi:phosphate:Na+ symporter
MFIHKAATKEPSTALDALQHEAAHFIAIVCHYIQDCFEIDDRSGKEIRMNKKFLESDLSEKYEYVKSLHGEILSYCIQLQKTITDTEDSEELDRLVSSVRNAMYAAKSFKDALPDKEQLHNSSNEVKFAFYNQTKPEVENFCKSIQKLMKQDQKDAGNSLTGIYRSVTSGYTKTLQHFYKEGTAEHVNETEISTMLNFNREIFTGFKSLVFAVKDYLLDKEQSKLFDDLPGFIR